MRGQYSLRSCLRFGLVWFDLPPPHDPSDVRPRRRASAPPPAVATMRNATSTLSKGQCPPKGIIEKSKNINNFTALFFSIFGGGTGQ